MHLMLFFLLGISTESSTAHARLKYTVHVGKVKLPQSSLKGIHGHVSPG